MAVNSKDIQTPFDKKDLGMRCLHRQIYSLTDEIGGPGTVPVPKDFRREIELQHTASTGWKRRLEDIGTEVESSVYI